MQLFFLKWNCSLQPSPSEPTDLSPENQDDSIPKADTELIDIPNSVTLWEVSPRPEHAADVSKLVHNALVSLFVENPNITILSGFFLQKYRRNLLNKHT